MKIIDQIVLPVNLKPMISTYEHHATVFAGISFKDDYLDWLYSNYIQIWCSRDFETNRNVSINYCDNGDDYHSNYNSCPFMWTYAIPNQYVGSEGDVVQFFKRALQDQYYVRPFLDVYYLPDSSDYGVTHYIAGKQIYGYDDRKQTFNLLGYRDGQYLPSEIPYALVEQAFYANKNEQDWQSHLHLGHYEEARYGLDLTRISQLIHDYTYSTQRNLYKEEWKKTDCFGLETYTYIIQYLHALQKGDTTFDIRPSHLMWEHKHVMLKRLNRLVHKKVLDASVLEKYGPLVEQTVLLRNYLLKYKRVKDNKVIDRIVVALQHIHRQEYAIMQEIEHKLAVYRPA
ncbi:hypothetical protein ACH6EH_03265 [Paenibacillus sp. JSM ZJ436]|uniref:hypothetical protein n=1 Tax=Paenibacillus sp. JSM ZJ436 TaxID=3376190 RepID=UPI0037A2959F